MKQTRPKLTSAQILEDLAALNSEAEDDIETARQFLSEGTYRDHAGVVYQRNGPEATAHVLLAIEGRFAMATLLLAEMMKEESPLNPEFASRDE